MTLRPVAVFEQCRAVFHVVVPPYKGGTPLEWTAPPVPPATAQARQHAVLKASSKRPARSRPLGLSRASGEVVAIGRGRGLPAKLVCFLLAPTCRTLRDKDLQSHE